MRATLSPPYLTRSTERHAPSLLQDSSTYDSHCYLRYEVAQSDKDPLRYVILERYRSKDDYLGAHRRSPAFREFRPQMRALQESGRVTVTGSSYQELGIGFT